MSENISIEEKAAHAHNTIIKAKHIMLVLNMDYLELSDMINFKSHNKICNVGILHCITERMGILIDQLKGCIDECNDLYTEISENKDIQDQYGFDNEKVKEDSISFNNAVSTFINSMEEILNLTNEFIKINSEGD